MICDFINFGHSTDITLPIATMLCNILTIYFYVLTSNYEKPSSNITNLNNLKCFTVSSSIMQQSICNLYMSVNTSLKLANCLICYYNLHILICNIERPCYCLVCDYKLPTTTHTGEDPFLSQLCEFNLHMATHSEEKNLFLSGKRL